MGPTFEVSFPHRRSDDQITHLMDSLNTTFGLNPKNEKKEAIIDRIRRDVAMANATQLLEKINSNCFEKCVTKIGSRLESGDEKCLSNCADKYMNSYNIVSRSLIGRLQKESSAGGMNVANSQIF